MNSATKNQQSKGIYWVTSREHFIHPTTNSSDQLEHRTTFCHYRPQRSWGKVMFLQASVILSTGGEYLTRYTPQTRYTPPVQVHPPDQVPPRPGTTPQTRYTPLGPGTPPLGQVHPPTRYTPRPGTLPDQVHPPGPGTPPQTRYPPRPGTPPPGAEHARRYGQRAGGTHPTGMHSCSLLSLILVQFCEKYAVLFCESQLFENNHTQSL